MSKLTGGGAAARQSAAVAGAKVAPIQFLSLTLKRPETALAARPVL